MIWECQECDATFRKPHIEYRPHRVEYWGAMTWEREITRHCPECGSDDLRDVTDVDFD